MASSSTLLMEILFWGTLGLLVYTYVGYPVLLGVFARVAPRRNQHDPSYQFPSVTLLISAYNEIEVIRKKLQNSLALEYPSECFEIIVISDGSDDGTDEVVQQFARSALRLVRQVPRQGKTAGLNLAVPQARGKILVFSDANAIYEPNAIRELVCHFSDPRVGYVVGNARYIDEASGTQAAAAEGLYWKIETWLKKKESAFYSVVGGDGALYAIRRELYTPLRPTDINDFLNPLQIINRGFLGVFEPAAVCYEEAAGSFGKEFRRRIRIISRGLDAVLTVKNALNPFQHTRHWFLLFSHKILRWFAPVFMVVLLLLSVLLAKAPLFAAALLVQVAFYFAAALGGILQQRQKNSRVFSVPFYFCVVNLASVVGCFRCLTGNLSGTWTPPRQKMPNKA
jgi:cellulose synthase/poly-beta-1,6-N-acetylglucosamine synthase-like glycosyltransferase